MLASRGDHESPGHQDREFGVAVGSSDAGSAHGVLLGGDWEAQIVIDAGRQEHHKGSALGGFAAQPVHLGWWISRRALTGRSAWRRAKSAGLRSVTGCCEAGALDGRSSSACRTPRGVGVIDQKRSRHVEDHREFVDRDERRRWQKVCELDQIAHALVDVAEPPSAGPAARRPVALRLAEGPVNLAEVGHGVGVEPRA